MSRIHEFCKGGCVLSDLFDRESEVLKRAEEYIETQKANSDEPIADIKEFEWLKREYARLLRQLQRVTKLTDRTTDQLNTDRLDLMDKVNYDALTGIYNRRYLDATLPVVLQSLMLTNGDLGILMIDVDFFKFYNDTYGHSAGDDCLKAVARAIRDSLDRHSDFVARYGGEEFTVVLPNANERGATLVAEKILKNIAGLNLPHESSTVEPYVTVSIGVVSAPVSSENTIDKYMEKSDSALYTAKRTGRNRVAVVRFDEE